MEKTQPQPQESHLELFTLHATRVHAHTRGEEACVHSAHLLLLSDVGKSTFGLHHTQHPASRGDSADQIAPEMGVRFVLNEGAMRWTGRRAHLRGSVVTT